MAKKIGFEQIDRARQILMVGEHVTLEEIKDSYRRLAAKYHPDRCRGTRLKECEKRMREINHSKDLLLAYCANYRYSFEEKDVMRNSFEPEAYEYLRQVYDGWVADL